MKNVLLGIGKGLLLSLWLVSGLPTMSPAQRRERLSLSQALTIIEQRFNTKFAYQHNLLRDRYTTPEALKGSSLEAILKNILYPNNILFLYVSDNAYSLVARDARFFNTPSSDVSVTNLTAVSLTAGIAQVPETIRGIVTTPDGTPLPFANVLVKDTRRGTQTAERGEFSLPGTRPGETLVFSHMGYKNQELLLSSLNRLTIVMSEAAGRTLSEVEVVSTGYQAVSKERATGAFGTMSARELEKVPTPNLIQRLEGQIPGVQVSVLAGDNTFTYENTQPALQGGNRTVGRNDYNLAIRGVSTYLADSSPLIVVDGAITDLDLKTYNPRDIERITALKDAAAASIWGVRAANGVIVITTKKGVFNQAPRLSISTDLSSSGAPRLDYLRTMSAAQTINYEEELVRKNLIVSPLSAQTTPQNVAGATDLAFQLRAGRITQSQYNAEIAMLSARDNRSQIRQYLLQPASSQQYNLSLSGGSSSSTYFYGGSYSREMPNARGTTGERFTLTLNNAFTLLKNITFSSSLKASLFNYGRSSNATRLAALYSPSASTLMPYDLLVDDAGNSVSYARTYYGAYTNRLQTLGYLPWRLNYLSERDNANNTQKDNNYVATFNLQAALYKGLSVSVLYANERSFGTNRYYYNETTFYTRDLINTATTVSPTGMLLHGLPTGGILSQVNTTINNYSLRGQLHFDRTVNQRHQINAIAGSEIRETNISQSTGTLYGYNTQTGISQNVNFATPYTTIQGYELSPGGSPSQADKQRRYLSYYANGSYSFLERYTLSASIRYDDYNNFGVDRSLRATPLWSSGLNWNIAQENFLKPLKWVNSLGLRATYGVNGTINTDQYPFTYLALGASDYVTTNPYASIVTPANPALRWEKTIVFNLGVDFGLCSNRLVGSLDWYSKKGSNLLASFPINPTYGVSNLTLNSSSLLGQGVDVGVRGKVLNHAGLSLDAGLTLSYTTNTVSDNRYAVTSATFLSPLSAEPLVGYPIDKVLVYRNAGLDATGLTLIYDEKGEKIPASQLITSLNALAYAGRLTAPVFGSFHTLLRLNRFSLYALATYSFGNVFLRPTISSYVGTNGRSQLLYDLSADVAGRWQKPGDERTTNVPGISGVYAPTSLLRYQSSDINVLPGDYIRLREISLTYQLPTTLLGKLTARSGTLGVTARNLGLLWTKNKQGYDPEFVRSLKDSSLGLPPSTGWTCSFSLNF